MASVRRSTRTAPVVQEPTEDEVLDQEGLEGEDNHDGDDDDNELDIENSDVEEAQEEVEPEAPSPTVIPPAQWETPTGTPIQIIHKCNHQLTGILTELLANPQYCKRVVAVINGSTPVDASGKRPGDYWLEEVNHYQSIKRQATNALVAEAMNQ